MKRDEEEGKLQKQHMRCHVATKAELPLVLAKPRALSPGSLEQKNHILALQ